MDTNVKEFKEMNAVLNDLVTRSKIEYTALKQFTENASHEIQTPLSIERDTNLIIGDAGFKGLPNEAGEIDLGYGIIESKRKKGFALEAAAGILNWAFNQKEVKAITASCLIDNLGSQKILSLLNFSIIETDNEMMYWRLPNAIQEKFL